MVRLSTVSLDFLFAAILVVVMVGVYIATLSLLNFVLIIIFGLLGLFMKKFGYSRPALLLGFVLGGLFENYLLLSLKIYGMDSLILYLLFVFRDRINDVKFRNVVICSSFGIVIMLFVSYVNLHFSVYNLTLPDLYKKRKPPSVCRWGLSLF